MSQLRISSRASSDLIEIWSYIADDSVANADVFIDKLYGTIQELMSEGKNLRLQRCTSLKDLPSRRKQREKDRGQVAKKLQRRLPKFNQFSQNEVLGRDRDLLGVRVKL